MTRNLILFYSQTGNTRHIAELIQKRTGGTLCEIKPEIPYKNLYLGGGTRVKQERRDGVHPAILPVQADVEDYDTIFLGTPNWGNGIAHPLMTFLDEHPLAGKVIYPFCTHGGGGLAHVASDIKKYCPDAEIGASFDTYGNGGSHAEREVAAWLEHLCNHQYKFEN